MAEPLEQLFGRLIDVQLDLEGSVLAAAAGFGATVLQLQDAGDFNADGGQVMVAGTVYDYLSADYEANTITLAAGLTVAAAEDDPVDAFDDENGNRTAEYNALVLLDDQDPDDEPIEVGLHHGLVDYLRETIRGGATETVSLIRDGEDDWVIWQVGGKLAINLIADAAAQEAADAADMAMNALTAAQLAQAITDGHIDYWYQTTPPWPAGSTGYDANFGDIWVDTDSSPQAAYRWMERQWQAIGNNSLVQALFDAQDAQVTADGKIRHFIGYSFPTGTFSYGDIFTHQGQDNREYYWDGDSWEPNIKGNQALSDILAKTVQVGSSGGNYALLTDISGYGGGLFLYTGGTFKGGVFVHQSTGHPTLMGPGGMYISYNATECVVFGGGFRVADAGLSSLGGFATFGGVDAQGDIKGQGIYSNESIGSPTADPVNANVNGTSGRIRRSTASAARYKENIRTADDLDVDQLLALEPKRFDYREDYCADAPPQVGFIADDADALGLDFWVYRDEAGDIETFDYVKWVVALQAVARREHAARLELEQKVADQEQRLAQLEQLVATLTTPSGSEA